MKRLFFLLVSFLFTTVFLCAQSPVSPKVDLIVQGRYVSPGTFARIPMYLQTNVPIKGIEVLITFPSDSIRNRYNVWLYSWSNNSSVATYVVEDTIKFSILDSQNPLTGSYRFCSLPIALANYLPTDNPDLILRLNISLKAAINWNGKDTLISASYVGSGYIFIGPKISLYGDMDDSQLIDLLDVLKVEDLSHGAPSTMVDFLRADVSSDGRIDSYDVRQVQSRSVNPYWMFEVQDYQGTYSGKGRIINPAGVKLQETENGVYVSLIKNETPVFNGDFYITAPVATAEVGNILKEGGNTSRLSINGNAMHLSFIGGESGIPADENVLFLRGVRAADIKIHGMLNEGIPIQSVIYKTTDIKDDPSGILKDFSLLQNYPNPFNPETVISFNLPKVSRVRLSVYNTLGELIATLADGELSAGKHTLPFNGSRLASGIYFYRLETNKFSKTMKMILAK
jgi:hypothetical protein